MSLANDLQDLMIIRDHLYQKIKRETGPETRYGDHPLWDAYMKVSDAIRIIKKEVRK